MNESIKAFLNESLNLQLSGKPWEMWVVAIVVVVICYLILKLLLHLVGRRLARF
ncbi:MAG: hypothetical protein P8101_15780 [Candidatus Thiodiazotropha sp.]